jgi:predicted transcriptional regulator
MSTREKAIEALRELPEDASWPDIEDRIHFLASVERGRQDIREGKVVPHEEVTEALAGWITQ